MQYIGIMHGGTGFAIYPPKRELLLFDRVAVIDLKELLNYWRSSDSFMQYDLLRGFESLYNKGLCFEPVVGNSELAETNLTYKNALEQVRKIHREIAELNGRLSEKPYIEIHDNEECMTYRFRGPLDEVDEATSRRIRSLQYEAANYDVRCACIQFREQGFGAVPLFPLPKTNVSKSMDHKRTEVIELVLNKLPVISHDTPLEAIIEFRNDPDSKDTIAGLRTWITEVAKGNLERNEIADKLDHLLYQYQKALQLHRMKFKSGTLETVVVTLSEVLEGLVKFRWGQLARTLFTIHQRELELLEAELQSPGSELSYIIKAQEKFSQ